VDRAVRPTDPPTASDPEADLRELRALLAAASHDLRTPIAAILGLAVTLERQLDEDQARDLASRIAANARRLDRMLTDLLDLDRLSSGLAEPTLWPVDLGELLARVVEGSATASEREVSVEATRLVVEVDESKVERIVENLLANAVRHTPPGSHIWASVRPRDDGALFAVEDDGPGVGAERREAIFDPVRRGDGPDRSSGAGMGLAIVARFAQLHGGRAWVEDRDGGGASFRVWLPARPG
jgi:signal transduction histidine kinase